MSNPLHPSLDAGQTERFLLAHLPIVILSTRNSRGRGPSGARALPPASVNVTPIASEFTVGPVWTGEPWPVSGLAGGPCYGGAPPRARDRILDVDAVEVR